MSIGIVVKYHPATDTKGSRQKATVTMPCGDKITAYNDCHDITTGGDAQYNAAMKVCEKADLRLCDDQPIHIDYKTVVYEAVGKTR